MMGDVQHGVDNTPSRVFFTTEELASFDNESFVQHWSKQDQYINWIESQLAVAQSGPSQQVRELEEKLRQSLPESARRESILLMRLNSKEQEMQDLIVQIQELKASQASNAVSLRSSLLDPAVNLLVQQLRKELEKAKSALEETQNELSAWKFTPDSNTGKRLMAKCRLLYQENEELGRMISSGRLAKLEGDLALQRNFSEEMKKSQSELDEFLLELDEDVEGMQSTIYFLQQQLRQTREQLSIVQKENETMRRSHQSQLGGESSQTADHQYLQTNGIMLDHSTRQSMSSPEQLDLDADVADVDADVADVDASFEPDVKQSNKRNTVNNVTTHESSDHGAGHCESEPDSNHFVPVDNDNGIDDEESDADDVQVDKESVSEEQEQRVGEADTTDTNEMRQNTEEEDEDEEEEGVGVGNVVVCQAVADEGLNLLVEAARTSNCSAGGSPDDGVQLNSDLVYNRADSGGLVSGSGVMDDDNEFRTNSLTSSVLNGEASEAAVKEDDPQSSDKCQLRKRTASQSLIDVDDRPSGSHDNDHTPAVESVDESQCVSRRKRCRSDSQSDNSNSMPNGKDDVDDAQSNS